MTLEMIAEVASLTTDADGVIRITGTRIPRATVITAFHQGATAETIVQQFSTLN